MSPSALVVGEALIDEVVDGDRVHRHPGGSPANVALGLARLGVPTVFHTAVGGDADGKLIEQHLNDSGVTLTRGSVTDARTSKAIATLATDGSATYQFTVSWAPAELDDVGSPTLIHTGSLGAFLRPGAKVTKAILRRGKNLGALITLDPNIRTSLLPDTESTRASFEELVQFAHLVKLSDEDAGYLYPGTTTEDLLDSLVACGAGVAVITRGGEGAYLASGGDRISIPAVKTLIVDTVGAGDSFMAAVIWSLAFTSDGWDGTPVSAERLTAVGTTAAHAAAITVSRPGADLPHPSDLQTGTLKV